MQTLFKFNNIFFITKILNNRYFFSIYNKNQIEISEKKFSKFG